MATRTKLGITRQTVAALNPWWRGAAWETTDRDLAGARASGLDHEARVLDGLTPGDLYVLRGPRRAGKTVATKQTISRLIASGVPPLSIVRFAGDGLSATELRTLVQNVPLPGPPDTPRWWFIDEATGMQGDWATTIKWLRDNLPAFGDGTVIVTGSNAEALTAATGTWAGRRGPVADAGRTLLPIGFRTWSGLVRSDSPPPGPRIPLADLRSSQARDTYHALIPWLDALVHGWDLYLLYGGFPVAAAAAKRGDPIPGWFIKDIFDVIHKDVFADSRASQATATALVERVTDGMGSPLNQSKVAEDVKVDHKSVARHVDYLRNGYLAWPCPQRHADRWIGLAGSQTKVYATDPLIARLGHLRNPRRDDVDPTILSEMMVGLALRRAALREGVDWDGDDALFHWKNASGSEIDFVSELLGSAAVEGKFVDDDGWRSESRTLKSSEWKGIMATRSILDTADADGPWAVPAGILAWLIDA